MTDWVSNGVIGAVTCFPPETANGDPSDFSIRLARVAETIPGGKVSVTFPSFAAPFVEKHQQGAIGNLKGGVCAACGVGLAVTSLWR
jgi:hypothetical protein